MKSLEIAALALDSGLLVLIWLVQLVIYPAFREVDAERFPTWHAAYSRRVSWVVIPLMFGQLGVTSALVVGELNIGNVLAMAGVLLAWVSTFLQAVPLHRKLSQEGRVLGVIDRLLQVNQIRVFAWTAVWLLSIARF